MSRRAFTSRRDNMCKTVRTTVHTIRGIDQNVFNQFMITIHFPREDEEYSSRPIKSAETLNFKYSARFVPDELLKNNLNLVFEDPLVIKLYGYEGKSRQKQIIYTFRINCKPLIKQKVFNYTAKGYSTKMRRILLLNLECAWESSFDRNIRKHADIDIFDVSDFTLLQSIGQGRSATFDLVKDNKNQNLYVMKKFKENDKLRLINSGNDRETDALITFNHPTLLHIVGYIPRRFLKNQQGALILDYIPNGSLSTILESSTPPLNWNETKRSIVLYGIAYGLQLLHSNGLMHYELRTSSILLDDNCEPKIGDIGLTRFDTSELEIQDLVYKAPEILLGKAFNYSADVYAYGMVLYRLITGHEAFEGCTLEQFNSYIMNGIQPYLDPLYTPPNLYKLFYDCIAFEPKSRPDLCELIKDRDEFIFPGTDIKEFYKYCDKINLRTVKSDPSLVTDRILESANDGNCYSQFLYGLLNKKNNVCADYFKLAADQNIDDAQYNFGIMLIEGINVAVDPVSAIYYFKSAADRGHVKASLNIGMMLTAGKYLEKNDKEAIKYFLYASQHGNTKAIVNLGLMTAHGRGIRKNEAEAMRLYKQAADLGDVQGQFNLAIMYSRMKGHKQNDVEALRYLRKAADKGVAKAQFSMGVFLLEGRGLKKNIYEASQYFMAAAKQNHPKAQLNIGLMLLKGHGIQKDVDMAIHYFKLAADQNEDQAQLNLGLLFMDGKEVSGNYVLGAQYLGDAAANGNKKAMIQIGLMFFTGKHVNIDYKIAGDCFRFACRKGDLTAKQYLDMLVGKGLYNLK